MDKTTLIGILVPILICVPLIVVLFILKMKPVLREILIFVSIIVSTYVYGLISSNIFSLMVLLFAVCPAYVLIRLLILSIKEFGIKTFLKSVTLIIGIFVLLAVLIAGYDYMLAKGPTAIVIDAETGKPLEGAVALAQWLRAAGGSAFEGGSEALDKTREAFSDKDGKIYIEGFWRSYIFSEEPRLTVFKPGYVLWDSNAICPVREDRPSKRRREFTSGNKIVKLLKFDAEASSWAKKYQYTAKGSLFKGPHLCHEDFFSNCFGYLLPQINNDEIKIDDLFYQYEKPFLDKETAEARNSR